ncbi:MAG: hypothetical protein AMXMBFR82_34260 [Candidatus Hydrogenedentota bacterium]
MSGRPVTQQTLYLSALLRVIFAAATVPAWGDGAAVDLIGRGNTFTVVERNGGVQEIDESALSVQDGKSRSYGKLESATPGETSSEPATEEPATEDAESAESPEQVPAAGEETATPEGETAPETAAPASEPAEETPEEKAAREEDVRAVRAMLDQGGAYFYDENNNPLSYQQVSAMIREGDVENIRAQGLHLSSWKPTVNELKDAPQTGASASAYGGGTAPGTKKSVHEIVAEGKPFQETVKDDPKFDPKKYSAGTPENGEVSPLAVPEERRPFREVLQEDQRQPFDPKKDYTENY